MKEQEAVHQLVFKALVGSHNYNLNHEKSDHDYKQFVMPSFEDLYFSREVSKATEPELQDCVTHDIRMLANCLKKSNITYIEVLFTEELTFGDLSAGEGAPLMALFEAREAIARMNLPYLYNSTFGVFFNHHKYFEKGTSATQELVQTYGYDTKQAFQCARLLDVLIRYASQGFDDFKSAIWFEADSFEYQELQRIRNGYYTKEDMLQYLQNKKEYVETEIKPLYYAQSVDFNRQAWIDEQLQKLIKEMLKINIK